jgi:hypothetical protein
MANKKAKQDRLPGTDGGIPELETLSYEYAAIRDQRMELLKQEVELKGKLLAEMHKNSLTTYKYQDLELEIIPGEEKIKVVVEKEPEAA